MSKASEWAGQGGVWRTNRPTFQGPTIRCQVTDEGVARLWVSRELGPETETFPDELLALAEWARETFGEGAA